jgi:hypothetical protein
MKFLKTSISICLCLAFFGCEKEVSPEQNILKNEAVRKKNVTEPVTPLSLKIEKENPSFENEGIISASGSSVENVVAEKEKITPVVPKVVLKKYELPKSLPTVKDCEKKQDILEQISCYADRATMEKKSEMCDVLEVDSAKFQCYSFYAERAENEALCKKISIWTHSTLKDTCIKNVAKTKGDAEICNKISAAGLNFKDDCFFEIYQITQNAALCEKISNEELKLKCSGENIASPKELLKKTSP